MWCDWKSDHMWYHFITECDEFGEYWLKTEKCEKSWDWCSNSGKKPWNYENLLWCTVYWSFQAEFRVNEWTIHLNSTHISKVLYATLSSFKRQCFSGLKDQTLNSACFKLSYKSASSAEVQPTLRFLTKVGCRLADTQVQLSLAKLAEYDGLFEVYFQPTWRLFRHYHSKSASRLASTWQ